MKFLNYIFNNWLKYKYINGVKGGIILIIPCSEKCAYEKEGLCTLKHATYSSGTPLKDCPYYKEKNKNKDKAPK